MTGKDYKEWSSFLEREMAKDYFISLRDFVEEEYQKGTVYPPKEDIFNALLYTNKSDVKVVILGQDPYHNEHQAHGLSFSVLPEQTKLPPSLQNIYKELNSDLGCEIPDHGYLKKWADQGVLLLNTVLTVREHEPNSHQNKGWEIFTEELIKEVNDQEQPVVFLLWGNPAQKKKKLITNPKHIVLCAAHPSPLSAYRGFFGCKHFSQTNEFLEKNNRTPIDWQIDEKKDL